MNRKQLKEKAIKLRKQCKTYSEIKRDLGVAIPKSTLSNWCHGIELPSFYREKIKQIALKSQAKSRTIAMIVKKEKRKEFLKSLTDNNLHLLNKLEDKNILKIILSVIYSCEGTKWKSHSGLSIGNTDKDLLRFYIKTLKICYPNVIDETVFRCRVSHRADQDIGELNTFWSNELGIPLCYFYKSSPDPRTVGKPTKNKDYKGVCVVSSRSSAIQLELEAIAKMIFASFN
ncbi:hypothetical protein FJ208_01490 [Candidatus Gribaldobacteria bacterium]|nr:hypothetical protein [Candidatus Gribaldobacteria bacterium]